MIEAPLMAVIAAAVVVIVSLGKLRPVGVGGIQVAYTEQLRDYSSLSVEFLIYK